MATTITLKSKNPGPSITLQTIGGLTVPANGGTLSVVPSIFSEVEFLGICEESVEITGLITSLDLVLVVNSVELSAADALKALNLESQKDFEAHTTDTANPHAVTKSQVGLSNVTNDAQLKRSAGDFATFDVKASPTTSDILLIEDQADSGNKKKITISALPTGSGDTDAIHKSISGEIHSLTEKTSLALNDEIIIEDSVASYAKKKALLSAVASSHHQSAYDNTLNSTTSTSTTSPPATTALTFQISPAVSGLYLVQWYGEFANDSTNTDSRYGVSVSDGTTTTWLAGGASSYVRIHNDTRNIYDQGNGCGLIQMTTGKTYTVTMVFGCEAGQTTVRNASIFARRIN